MKPPPSEPQESEYEVCPHCGEPLSDAWIKAAHSRVAGKAGGRPAVVRPCPFCGEKFAAREMRAHRPICKKKPKRARRTR